MHLVVYMHTYSYSIYDLTCLHHKTVMISATSVPLMMELVQSEHSKEEDIEFFNLEPHADYSGIENIKPLEVIEVEEDGTEEDGMADDTNKKLTAIFSAEQSAMKKKVYLEQNELSVKSTFEYEDLNVIYANEKVSLCSCNVLKCSCLSNFPIYLHFPHQYTGHRSIRPCLTA